MTLPGGWQACPPIMLPSPTLALASGPDGSWAGGYGGVAAYGDDGAWHTLVSGLPLTSVAALTYADGWLLAGGAGGIARSRDRGQTWELAAVVGPVEAITALAASPRFASDTTVLAGTLGSGVLRSTDAGKTWQPALSGLQGSDVTAILWLDDALVLLATDDGIYRSTTAGSDWHSCEGSSGTPIAGFAALADGTLLGAVELGGILRSTDNGVTWSRWGDLPSDTQATTLLAVQNSVLLGTVEHGLLRSLDAGVSWHAVAPEMVLCLTATTGALLAGTEEGVLQSVDQGATWQALPPTPLHDLRRFVVVGDELLVAGAQVPPVRYDAESGWTPLQTDALPIVGIAGTLGGTLFLSSHDGLLRSVDLGASWEAVISGEAGALAHFAFRPDGHGWAGSADGHTLYQTTDHGATWQPLTSPFAGVTLIALEASADLLMAGTYDAERKMGHLWRSKDGIYWQRGIGARTAWPHVATAPEPACLSLGNNLLIERAPDMWAQVGLAGSGIRRIVVAASRIFVLTTAGIMRTNDFGQNWNRDDEGLPIAQVMDIRILNSTLYVLLAGGNVWTRTV